MVMNNTVANYGGVAVAMSPGAQSVWDSSDLFYNNVGYATAGFSVDSNVSGYSSASNKFLSSGASNIFVDYATWDLHLKSTDTTLKDAGVSTPSSYFTTDKDATSRPKGAAWDIGAYELLLKTPNPPNTIKVN
jgi:hypothetical protein